ncbi:MAG: hypothetical protein Q9181_002160 [Wetmoreana brouardii]
MPGAGDRLKEEFDKLLDLPARSNSLPGFAQRTLGEAMLLAIDITFDPKACVYVETLSSLVLFHCAFIALRSEDKEKPVEYFHDQEIHGEKSIYAGRIVDDNYEHALRVFRDRDCGGIRLQASVLSGELKRKPIWTAFITTHIESQRWMRKVNSKTIHLADLQQYIFSTEYNPQSGPAGQHELRFVSSRDNGFILESNSTQPLEQAMSTPQESNSKPGEAQQYPPSTETGSSCPESLERKDNSPENLTQWQKILNAISYTPKRCRYDPTSPPRFSTSLNLLFAFAGAFTVANLYYSHPILHLLAREFRVSNERASLIPTLAQTGYAAGLLFLCPLGDVFPRRLFVLALVLFTATVWLGLCLTNSFSIFCFLTFLTSVTTVTPQLILPLVGDLAPPDRRATALSLIVSGLLMGLLLARLLSGVVTNYAPWRTIYWIAFGLQYLIFTLLWLFMPDYPSSNPAGINYFRILWSILTIFIRHPLLVQACLVAFCTSAIFTNFWTTLTFLLSSPPYEYSTLAIGLFALIAIATMFLGPLWSRHVTDRFIPLFSVILGLFICLIGTCIGTYTGTFSVAGPIIQAFTLDFGIQTSQIANRSAIYSILPKARNRVNTAFMLAAFCGQLTGTAVGNHVYAIGGWISSGSTSVGFLAAAFLLCAVRGPRETGWFGWSGGWAWKKKTDVGPADEAASEVKREEGAGKGTAGEAPLGEGEKGQESAEQARYDMRRGAESATRETGANGDIDLEKV